MRAARKTAKVLVVLAVVALAGCTSAAQKLQEWQGKPIADLIASRGPADRIVAYPFGGRLYIWEERALQPSGSDMSRRSSAPRIENVVRREIAHVNDAGIITATRVEQERPRPPSPTES